MFTCECRCLGSPGKDIRCPRVGVTIGCELSDMVLGTKFGSSARAVPT